MQKETDAQRVLDLAAQCGLISTRDVEAQRLHRQALTRLVRTNKLERVARGRYRLPDPDYELTEHHGFVLASVAAPSGVICLLSALQFHIIGTQLPRQVWIALDRKARKPVIDYPPLRVVRFSGKALTEGIEEHVLEGQTIRVYSVAKTLADCFKYRNKIGLDVAVEALHDVLDRQLATRDEILQAAEVCRVKKVITPYIEAMSI